MKLNKLMFISSFKSGKLIKNIKRAEKEAQNLFGARRGLRDVTSNPNEDYPTFKQHSKSTACKLLPSFLHSVFLSRRKYK